MNIAIAADPYLPVPPQLYGGIERIIAMLAQGYLTQGHEVSLFAHSDSVTKAKLYPYPRAGEGKADDLKNAYLINKTLFANKYDIVHNFARLAYLLPQLPTGVIKIMSYQREPTISQVKKAHLLAKKDTLYFTGCSNYISRQITPFAPAYTVYNGVEAAKYQFIEHVPDNAPLVFLGRIEPEKGVHIAIALAKETGRKLIIAGNIPIVQQTYFNNQIRPHLDENISYTGPVNDQQKNTLLGRAAALLMPVQWNEPFGIVMIEAMACGTPVIGFDKGAVAEVIEHGRNGYFSDNSEHLKNYIGQLHQLSRKTVRAIFEQRFAGNVIINSYLDLYDKLLQRPVK